jgi:hypothetical protein
MVFDTNLDLLLRALGSDSPAAGDQNARFTLASALTPRSAHDSGPGASLASLSALSGLPTYQPPRWIGVSRRFSHKEAFGNDTI